MELSIGLDAAGLTPGEAVELAGDWPAGGLPAGKKNFLYDPINDRDCNSRGL